MRADHLIPTDSRRGDWFVSDWSKIVFESARRTIAMCVILGGSALAALLLAADAVAAPTVWSGLTHEFSKLGTDDPLLPEHQDRITDNVWLTRSSQFHGPSQRRVSESCGNWWLHLHSQLESSRHRVGHRGDIGQYWQIDRRNELARSTFAYWEACLWQARNGTILVCAAVRAPDFEDNIYLDFRFSVWDSAFGGGESDVSRAEGDLPPPNAHRRLQWRSGRQRRRLHGLARHAGPNRRSCRQRGRWTSPMARSTSKTMPFGSSILAKSCRRAPRAWQPPSPSRPAGCYCWADC